MGTVMRRNHKIAPGFWKGKRVLLTGHTGFKGAWLASWLRRMGTRVFGFSLPPVTNPSLHRLLHGPHDSPDETGDLRDLSAVEAVVELSQPEIVIHMAAQALVRPSYADPLETFSTNLMGTANLLESLRQADSLSSILVVTSDKVYQNNSNGHRFHESDPLGGMDPYSASKGCQDIIAHCYRRSFMETQGVHLVTARAGNVIGGGDWADDRLLTDVEAAISVGRPVIVRNPLATRPWQHVLEPLAGYLLYVQAMETGDEIPEALNFGPAGSAKVETVLEKYLKLRGGCVSWELDIEARPREAHTLEIDPGLAREVLNWYPCLDLDTTLQWVANWHNALADGESAKAVTDQQIADYENIMSMRAAQ